MTSDDGCEYLQNLGYPDIVLEPESQWAHLTLPIGDAISLFVQEKYMSSQRLGALVRGGEAIHDINSALEIGAGLIPDLAKEQYENKALWIEAAAEKIETAVVYHDPHMRPYKSASGRDLGAGHIAAAYALWYLDQAITAQSRGDAVLLAGLLYRGMLLTSLAELKLQHDEATRQEVVATEVRLLKIQKELRSKGGKTKSQNAGFPEKREIAELAWASGAYDSRDECAEKISAGLNISTSTARKYLRCTPDRPSRY